MKAKHLFLTALFLLAGCSLIWSPTATAKKFMTSAEKGDPDAMTALFSRRAIQRDGVEKIQKNNNNFAKLVQKANATGSYSVNNLKESKDGVNARVGFNFQKSDHSDSMRLVLALSKEGGDWKIDNIGGPKLEDITDLASAELKDPPVRKPESLETPPPVESSSPLESVSQLESVPPPPPPPPPSSHPPISGGVLNAKAISLPKPAYPPIAKAAKASGTVVVQVTVDENGNVISAHAVSGHPLLQAAAVAAARAAKFSPTKLSGQPVKVNGVINYNFVSE